LSQTVEFLLLKKVKRENQNLVFKKDKTKKSKDFAQLFLKVA